MPTHFHPGELTVQARAGVRAGADRAGRMLRPGMPPAARAFLRGQFMVVLGAVDPPGRVWASLLTGSPGFVRALDDRGVQIEAEPAPDDPACDALAVESPVGLLAIDFAARRRMRVNGRVEDRPPGAFRIRTEQVFSNCQKYIQARVPAGTPLRAGGGGAARRSETLLEEHRRWIERADTFFIATYCREGGADVSHRGGNPGFVRVLDERRLLWPDYAGNLLFQTLGNLALDPRAGLLFPDFERGRSLQLTGRARVLWDQALLTSLPGAERAVEFAVDRIVEHPGAGPRWRFLGFSPFNPG